MTFEPVLQVLVFATLAAVAAALGAVPWGLRRPPGARVIGVGLGLAGGCMLAVGYLLMAHALEDVDWLAVAGAVAGVLFARWAQSLAGVDALDEDAETGLTQAASVVMGYKLVLRDHLHAAAEGVALGVALWVDWPRGLFLVGVLALHNVAEALVLGERLSRLGSPARQCAGLAVVSNLTQPLLAAVTYAILPSMTGVVPAVLGFAAGALLYLVVSELLPGAYARATQPIVALAVSATAGAVVLLDAMVVGGGP